MTTKVFFSYAAKDGPFARELARSLVRGGVTVSDPAIDMKPGDGWGDAMMAALSGSDAVVMVLSDRADESAALMQELGAAHALEKRIVPVQIEAAPLPALLRNTQVLEAGHLSPDQIAATVRARLAA